MFALSIAELIGSTSGYTNSLLHHNKRNEEESVADPDIYINLNTGEYTLFIYFVIN